MFQKIWFSEKKTGDSTLIQWDPEDYLPLSTVAQMERCAKEINITQENLKNFIRIGDTTVTDEMSLNIDDEIQNVIEPDSASEQNMRQQSILEFIDK